MAGKHHRVGVDIGGTFTDLVLIDDETGRRAVGKVLTRPEDPSEGVESGLAELLGREGGQAGQVGTIVHGTTLVTNALIERRGARTALLTTEGFKDALAIGTEHRYDMYDVFIEKPEPLVPRSLRTSGGPGKSCPRRRRRFWSRSPRRSRRRSGSTSAPRRRSPTCTPGR